MIMTKFKSHLLTLFLLLFFAGACSDDENTDIKQDQIVTASEGELVAVIDGEKKSTGSVTAVLSDDNFMLTAVFDDNSALTIILDTIRETSYSMTHLSAFSYAQYVKNKDDESAAIFSTQVTESSQGEIEFTDINTTDNKFSGAFTLMLHNPNDKNEAIQISSSAFNSISYTVVEPSPGSFKATVDGLSWSAETISAKVISQVSILDIAGRTESGIDITINMPADVEPGVYQFSGNGDYVAVVYPAGQDMGTHFSSSGELTIISHDLDSKTIEGSFYFDATRIQDNKQYTITNGTFSYQGYN